MILSGLSLQSILRLVRNATVIHVTGHLLFFFFFYLAVNHFQGRRCNLAVFPFLLFCPCLCQGQTSSDKTFQCTVNLGN